MDIFKVSFPILIHSSKLHLQIGNKRWNSLEAPESVLFPWDMKSTYIRCPSFFDKLVSTSTARAFRDCYSFKEEFSVFNYLFLDQRAICTPAY